MRIKVPALLALTLLADGGGFESAIAAHVIQGGALVLLGLYLFASIRERREDRAHRLKELERIVDDHKAQLAAMREAFVEVLKDQRESLARAYEARRP